MCFCRKSRIFNSVKNTPNYCELIIATSLVIFDPVHESEYSRQCDEYTIRKEVGNPLEHGCISRSWSNFFYGYIPMAHVLTCYVIRRIKTSGCFLLDKVYSIEHNHTNIIRVFDLNPLFLSAIYDSLLSQWKNTLDERQKKNG